MTAAGDVARCLAGEISPAVALARLVLGGTTPGEIGRMLPEGSDIAALFASHGGDVEALAAMLRQSGVDHGDQSLDEIRRSFERAVRLSPEASVAAYSLGDPGLLGEATDELAGWLDREGLVRPGADVLDVGCGIGRVAAALSKRAGSVLGIDIAAGMVEQARQRHRGTANIRFELTDGLSLQMADGSRDLVLFVDSMPYLVQAGIADAHVAECARIMRPGAALAVFNLSYGDEGEATARRWAERLGLRLRHCGSRPFRSWDGAAFVFIRPQ